MGGKSEDWVKGFLYSLNVRVQRRAGRGVARAASVRAPTSPYKPAVGASAATLGWATALEKAEKQQRRVWL
jgi:hypothetical protein